MFTIILHGRAGIGDEIRIDQAVKCSTDVIFSTWDGAEYDAISKYAQAKGCNVLRSIDPGSSESYIQNRTQKFLNVDRFMCSFKLGLKFAKHDYVIRARPDLEIDYSQLWKIGQRNTDKILCLNSTTVAPERFFGPTFYSHACDWCHGGLRDYFAKAIEEHKISEAKLCLLNPIRNGLQLWSAHLSAEQIITLIYLGRDPELFSNFDTRVEGLKAVHEVFKEKFLNLSKEDVPHYLPKYRGISNQFYIYKTRDFSDTGSISFNFISLIAYFRLMIFDRFQRLLRSKMP
jgi:hypothetical protein